MCSFLLTLLQASKECLESINKKLACRGPDLTNLFFYKNICGIHNLLNITGSIQPQPFIQDDILCLYNGEIYNYKDFGDYTSDGQCLIPFYKKYGYSFPQKLDGEFTICLIDFTKQIVLIASDTFRTKPIFYSLSPVFSCSTFRTPLECLGAIDIHSFPPNTIQVFDLSNNLLIQELPTVQFELRQYKTDYNDWIRAFEQSIRKRATISNTRPYVCLSSGYDSGGICCALKNLDLDFRIFSIPTHEHQGILAQREMAALPNEIQYVTIEKEEIADLQKQILDSTEDFAYKIWQNNQWESFSFYNDNATLGISKICTLAKQQGLRVYLSGSGADEIMSDYAFSGTPFFIHSCFNGVFPEDLSIIFPKNPSDTECVWKNFYKSTQEAYLMKEEYIGGAHGIEARYPYLDKQVVQEFLWLTPILKNVFYKAPLHVYLEKNGYPFEKGVKRGFTPIE